MKEIPPMPIKPFAASDAVVTPEPLSYPVPASAEPLLYEDAPDGAARQTAADILFEKEYAMSGGCDVGSWDPPSLLTLLFGDS